jgi:hypothetical protein
VSLAAFLLSAKAEKFLKSIKVNGKSPNAARASHAQEIKMGNPGLVHFADPPAFDRPGPGYFSKRGDGLGGR